MHVLATRKSGLHRIESLTTINDVIIAMKKMTIIMTFCILMSLIVKNCVTSIRVGRHSATIHCHYILIGVPMASLTNRNEALDMSHPSEILFFGLFNNTFKI